MHEEWRSNGDQSIMCPQGSGMTSCVVTGSYSSSGRATPQTILCSSSPERCVASGDGLDCEDSDTPFHDVGLDARVI